METISEDDLRKEYASHADRFRRPALIRVSQLLVPEPRGGRSRAEAPSGGRALAGDLADAEPGSERGDGWLSRPSRANRPAARLRKGPLGAAGRADDGNRLGPHGFHILRVDERFDGRDIPFDEAKSALRLSLAEERSVKAAADLVAGARRRHPVAVVEEHLPFPYVGTNPRYVGVAR